MVVGRPASSSSSSNTLSGSGSGAGGGLAGSKLDKEIKRVGGCAVRYVGVEW